MNSPKISIIVPIYNTEKYLEKCIMSILNQTLKDIELILVNDGSTDCSLDICNRFREKDKRVKVINQSNSGQGVARNRGLSIAKGEYIAFVDSDDYIDGNMYEKMYEEIKKRKCDIVVCQVKMVNESGITISVKDNKNIKGELETGEETIIRYLKEGRWGPCDKLYKKDVLKGVKFLEDRTCEEDHAVIIPILKQTKKVVTINEYLYNYLVREGSTTSSKFSKKNFDAAYVWEYVMQESLNMNDEIKKLSEARLYSCYINLINGAIQDNINSYLEEVFEIRKKIKLMRDKISRNQYVLKQYKIGGNIIHINFKLYLTIFKLSRLLKVR